MYKRQTLGFVADSDVKRQLHALGLEPAPMDRAAFTAFLKAQSTRLGTLVKKERVEGAHN